MIFYRSLDYKLHMELPKPPEAISIDQAAKEILEGVEAGRNIVPIEDFARKMYHAIGTNLSEVDDMMWQLANQRHEDPQYRAGEISGE